MLPGKTRNEQEKQDTGGEKQSKSVTSNKVPWRVASAWGHRKAWEYRLYLRVCPDLLPGSWLSSCHTSLSLAKAHLWVGQWQFLSTSDSAMGTVAPVALKQAFEKSQIWTVRRQRHRSWGRSKEGPLRASEQSAKSVHCECLTSPSLLQPWSEWGRREQSGRNEAAADKLEQARLYYSSKPPSNLSCLSR